METKTDQPPWIDETTVHVLHHVAVPWDKARYVGVPLCGHVVRSRPALWMSAERFELEHPTRRCQICEGYLRDKSMGRAVRVDAYLAERARAKVTATNSDVIAELDRIERAARLLVYLYAATLAGGGIAAIIAYLWAR